jgi:hypothetical protein
VVFGTVFLATILIVIPNEMKPSEPTSFEKFDTLTRGVMSVPKAEIDKRAEKARKDRAERKKR